MGKDRENGIGVWMFEDGERHWVAAESAKAAIEYFKGYCELTPEEYAEYVTGPEECTDLDAKTIFDYDNITGREPDGSPIYATITMRQAVQAYAGKFPAVVAGTVY